MSNFIQLVKNEQMKTYSQIATWVMYIVLAIFIIGFGVVMKVDQTMTDDQQASGDNWKQELKAENEQLQKEAAEQEFVAPINEKQITMNEYRIENNVEPDGYDVWNFVQDNRANISIISLLTIIIAAGMIANEFKWGSIKLLLIRPISRTKILASKYVSVLVFAMTMLLFLYVLSFLTGSVLFGFENFMEPYLYWKGEEIQQAAIFQFTLSQYLLSSVNLIMMATFAFMISAIFRNSSLAIGIAIFLMMSGNAIVGFFSSKEWAKFILFANTNLNQFFTGTPVISDLTLTFSVSILVVYLVLFLGLSWFFFSKRDITNV
ncbi:ABC transporter permease [Halobacillus naozhouensis]|uniref:ABC transporter permease n=1 Tax=Halobacillus naozhouensis TaxID=554880 RepID=A0ABY8IY12_9BACI|nr:ABC transporter permease [Halobacillus naozhouensis]WFT75137.1 ABC transporter permease [Halobacillus naozhouensis]